MITDKLKEIVGNDQFSTYMADLEKQREIRSEQIMAETKHLYHFSQVSPEKFGEYLIPKPQERGNALSDKIGKSLCCAAKTDESMYIIKPPSSDPQEYNSVGCHMDETLVFVVGLNPEDFIRKQELSYCYEVDKSTFKPNVSLDGNFTNEYESATKARVISIKGPFSMVDMCKPREEGGWAIPVYFCPKSEDKKMIMDEINKLRGLGWTKRNAFLQISREHPNKLIYFNENKKLIYFSSQQEIEQTKPEKRHETEKNPKFCGKNISRTKL